MVEAGEDPRFIARRLVILASEDIGLADPTALTTAVAAAQAVAADRHARGAAQPRPGDDRAGAWRRSPTPSSPPSSAASADVRAGKIGPVPPHLRDAHYARARRSSATATATSTATTSRSASPSSSTRRTSVADAAYYRAHRRWGRRPRVKERWERIRRLIRGR